MATFSGFRSCCALPVRSPLRNDNDRKGAVVDFWGRLSTFTVMVITATGTNATQNAATYWHAYQKACLDRRHSSPARKVDICWSCFHRLKSIRIIAPIMKKKPTKQTLGTLLTYTTWRKPPRCTRRNPQCHRYWDTIAYNKHLELGYRVYCTKP